MATFLEVPAELKEKILCFLPAVDLSSMEKCSRSLRALVVEEDLWRKRAELLMKWSKGKMEQKIKELEEENKPRICENPGHHITVARARFVRIEGDCSGPVIQEMWQRPPVQVLRFYTHTSCGGAVCTECLGRHLGNCFDYCLVCGGDLVSPFDEDEVTDEEDYQQEFSEGKGFEKGEDDGDKDENTDEIKLMKEENDVELKTFEEREDKGKKDELTDEINLMGKENCVKLKTFEEGKGKENKDEHTDEIKFMEEENDVKLKSTDAQVRMNNEKANVESNIEKDDGKNYESEEKKRDDWLEEIRKKYPEVPYQDMQKCALFKPDPTDWVPSSQELIEMEINRDKKLQEMLSIDGNGKKVLQGLLEVMIEEPTPFKNMAMKEKGIYK